MKVTNVKTAFWYYFQIALIRYTYPGHTIQNPRFLYSLLQLKGIETYMDFR